MKTTLLTLTAALALAATGCSGDDSADMAYGADDPGSWGAGDAPGERGAEGEGEGEGEAPQAGQLTAGEWRDLDNWSFWISLFGQAPGDRLSQHLDLWGLHPLERVAAVLSYDGQPAANVELVLEDDAGIAWTARTDNRGRAELWPALKGPAAPGALLRIGETVVTEDPPTDGSPIELDLAALGFDAPPEPQGLDIMLVVDTTGSMCDELRYLQAELAGVLTTVRDTYGEELSMRVSVQVYRDDGDAYVVRQMPFTDMSEAADDLARQGCDGGGDYPEAVGPALASAFGSDSHGGWRADARARLMFLVLDAPAHTDQETLGQLHAGVTDAAAAGARIIPVASSGVDEATEFMLRTFAIITGGTYVFLTDDSGIGNGHLEPTVGAYDVELLNGLMVRLITEALE